MTGRRVTVVLPVHDGAAFLPRAVDSLVAQRMPDWDAWLVDDGSADATADVAGRLAAAEPRLRVLRLPHNCGLGAALNAGLDRAAAPVIAYLPADDVWYPEHLDAVLAALAAPDALLAVSGVRHHGDRFADEGPPGYGVQLVQAAHRRTPDRWTERAELESDDLDRLFWHRLRARGRCVPTGVVTCEWVDHPGQRHKAIRESHDGGLNVFRSRYGVPEPLRFHSSDSGTVDEVARYARFRERRYDPAPDGLTVLLAGELAFNPERVLALAARGHRLHGLWTTDGLGDATVGPMPFGHVRDLPREGWRDAVHRLAPDVVHAQLNWRAVPFALEVRRATRGVPFVWHFKEAPQRSIVRGEWPQLAELVTTAEACLFATDEERDWFAAALAGVVDPGRLGVLDGDLPLAEWQDAPLAPKLSAADGAPHTVVVGRPSGLDGEFVLGLARAGVHVHLYGQVAAPGPKGAWRAWLADAIAGAPDRVHLHDAAGPERWVTEFSRYDAGWLHRFDSRNGGELRRASWDDLNSPARLPVLAAAGLPALQRANPGHLVSVERVLRETGSGLLYQDLDDVVDLLRAEVASGAGGAAALAARERFTFDAHADRLSALFRSLGGAATPRTRAPR